jgi:RND superfamily putative drug exporter
MKAIANFITSKRGAPTTMLLALLFAGLAFGPLGATKSDSAPGVGLPSDNETVLVDAALKTLPGSDATAAVIIYRGVNGTAITQADKIWLATSSVEHFAKYSNIVVPTPFGNQQVIPPVTYSDDGLAAVITVPMDKITTDTECVVDGVKETCSAIVGTAQRIKDMRALAQDGMPATLETKLTGPEGFVADLNGVFAGADFALLGTTFLVVIALLLISFRSLSLWLVPILVIGTADGMASSLATITAGWLNIELDASITGILSVLVIGAGIDYALLLISRYREELLVEADRRIALATAWRGAAPAIFASGLTVIFSLLTLLAADLEGNKALGIACATGVFLAMISALLVLPAALAIFGRWIFWPATPKLGGRNKSDTGLWAKLGKGVAKRPKVVASFGLIALIALASGAAGIKIGLSSTEQFTKKPEAVIGQEWLGKSFPAGSTTPTILIADKNKANDVAEFVKAVPGVASVTVGESNDTIAKISVVLDGESGSESAYNAIDGIRAKVGTLTDTNVLVGGFDAQNLDVKRAYDHDRGIVIPLILLVVFIVLLVLLRSIVAPVLLLATVVGSFFASMGAGWLLFTYVLGFPALDLSVYLFSFLFLVALGVDYNIFLVTRAKEESAKVGLQQGMLKALSSTGGVITSAGVLLAAVFLVLGVLPLLALAQIGAIVCIGVLLDTLLVRTVIVPALAFIAGERFWWPSKPKA